jgi:hypothetical protein
MSQAAQVAAATVLALAGLGVLAATGLTIGAIVIYRMLRRATAPRGPHTHLPGVMVVAFRTCPRDVRTRTAILHADDTATCTHCNAHIPAPEVIR